MSASGVGFILVIDRRQDRWAAVKGTLLRIAVSHSVCVCVCVCVSVGGGLGISVGYAIITGDSLMDLCFPVGFISDVKSLVFECSETECRCFGMSGRAVLIGYTSDTVSIC